MNGITECVVFFFWLPLLNTVLLRSSHDVNIISFFLLIAELPSIVWVFQNLFTYSPVDKYLSHYQFLIMLNKTAINIILQVFVWTYVPVFFVSISRSEIARQYEKYMFKFAFSPIFHTFVSTWYCECFSFYLFWSVYSDISLCF